jgi:hypothetical protein
MRTPSSSRAIDIFLIGSCFFIASLFVFEKESLCRLLPGMRTLYKAVGISLIEKTPLEIKNLTAHLIPYKGKDILSVTGTVVNTSNRPVRIPPLVIHLLSQEGSPLYAWTHETARAPLEEPEDRGQKVPFFPLAPLETELFRARLASPPQDAYSVGVFFLEKGTSPS